MAHPELHIDLIADLEEAVATLSAAASAMGEAYGSDDAMFDGLVEAMKIADEAKERLQARADQYAEMIHFGV